VTLEDVYNGEIKDFEVERYRMCKGCKGSGSNKEGVDAKCQSCNGRGVKLRILQTNMGMMQQQIHCPECRGQGFQIKDEDKCKECDAQKIKKEKTTLKVDIDKGAADGKRYTFQGESDEAPGIDPGDVIVEIAIEKHDKFLRKGADLVYGANISLLEALTGFQLEVTHLDGRKIYINTQKGEIIRPNYLKTVAHCGMPFFENPVKFGNLLLSFNIKFPEKLDKTQSEILFKVLHSEIPKEITENVDETCILTAYNEEECNTNYGGGKKSNEKNDDDYYYENEGGGGGQQIGGCTQQ
jgi:DnaJ-class molecular chaperone